jgi:hypothetical protein
MYAAQSGDRQDWETHEHNKILAVFLKQERNFPLRVVHEQVWEEGSSYIRLICFCISISRQTPFSFQLEDWGSWKCIWSWKCFVYFPSHWSVLETPFCHSYILPSCAVVRMTQLLQLTTFSETLSIPVISLVAAYSRHVSTWQKLSKIQKFPESAHCFADIRLLWFVQLLYWYFRKRLQSYDNSIRLEVDSCIIWGRLGLIVTRVNCNTSSFPPLSGVLEECWAVCSTNSAWLPMS